VNIFSRSASGEREGDSTQTIQFFCKAVVIIITIGVAARLVIGLFMTHIYDMYHWGLVIQNINSGNGLYELTGYFYTPVWGYFLGVLAFFQDVLGIAMTGEHLTEAFPMENISWYYISTVTTPAFNMSVKMLLLISDLTVGYLIFWLVRDVTKDSRKAVTGFALWFLCPFVIASGSVIGMFDTLSVLMTLLAVIMLRKDRYIESGVMLCMAALMKFFPGFFIFIFVAYILSKNRHDGTANKKLMMFLAGIAVTALIVFLPQILEGTIADSFLFITSRLSDGVGYDNIGAAAGYAALGVYVIAILVSVFFALRIMRNDDPESSDGLLFDALLITTAVMFLYPPLPQYVLLLLPFVIFVFMRDRRYMIPLMLLMIGTSVAALAGGPANLVAIAAYTNLLDLGSVMGVIGSYTGPFMGSSPLMLIGFTGSAIQYAGILTVLWVRFGERIKEAVRRHTFKENAEDA